MPAYDDLKNRILTNYHLSTKDIPDTIAVPIFDDVMNEYSRSFGLRAFSEISKSTGIADYTCPGDCHHFLYALWNASYPGAVLIDAPGWTPEQIQEYLNHPSLMVLEFVKRRFYEAHTGYLEQRAQIYRAGTNPVLKKINLDPAPTTNIFIVYRKLHTKDTYPLEDERIFRPLFEAKILRHCQSVGKAVTIGDVTYAHDRLDRIIQKFETEFYGHIQAGAIGRS
jgi:hypothetical protein